MKWSCDFETTTNEDDCRVWAYGCMEIGNDKNFLYGNNIDDFMQWCRVHDDDTLYFHNLKFDGEFILNWLFRDGFEYVENPKHLVKDTFNTLISDKGQFYALYIKFRNGKKYLRIYDSLKIIPFAVSDIAKTFGLHEEKLSIDYNGDREIGHELTDEEVKYLHNDVSIVASALKTLFDQNLKKMTQGSNALSDYKETIGKKMFGHWFPPPKYDSEIRQSYKGGFTYCSPRIQGKDLGAGIVLDVNSLYPSVMYYEALPYGEGVYFSGKYENDAAYPLYVQLFTCNFDLKDEHIPTIQLKNNLAFVPTEYVTSSNGEDITLCLTSVDLKLFFDHYDVYNITYSGGWKFRAGKGMFCDYIDKWNAIKMESTLNGNKGMRTLAKLMLNALYGKFALNPKVQSKIPYLEDGRIKYKLGKEETRSPIYLPVGTFITAYARNKTIRSAQTVYDRFCYADTDSLHLEGTELPEGLEIDPVKLGAWKHESTFTRARFVRQKTYIEEIEGKLNITCAGMPKRCYEQVTWENFTHGSVFTGKLMPCHTAGGIVLKETEFTLK